MEEEDYEDIFDEDEINKVEKQFDKDGGCECGSCGWSPCFYEIRDDLYRMFKKERKNNNEYYIYFAYCRNKYDENSIDHRGHWIYIEKLKEGMNEIGNWNEVTK